MNTEIYMILIAALFALVAFMLYAKFSSRSRGKLLHHSPGDISLESFDRGSVEEVGPTFDDLSEDSFLEEDTLLQEDRKSNSLPDLGEVHAELKEEETKEERQKEEEYLDDLQEAAAGLAMLMRSSPVKDRATPVIFAPEEEVEAIEEPVTDQASSRTNEEATILIPAIEEEGLTETGNEAATEIESRSDKEVDSAGVTESEPSAIGSEFDELEVQEVAGANAGEPERSHSDLLALLGDEVAEKFSVIDEDLDALEDLVAGVESRLSSWNSDGESNFDADEQEVTAVEKAA